MGYISECKTTLAELYKGTPVILVPAALGPAPSGLASTGDSKMNTPWTALGTPAISIPMPVAKGLPLGLQLTADHGQDARVIRTRKVRGGKPAFLRIGLAEIAGALLQCNQDGD